jgi:hypothetical protein
MSLRYYRSGVRDNIFITMTPLTYTGRVHVTVKPYNDLSFFLLISLYDRKILVVLLADSVITAAVKMRSSYIEQRSGLFQTSHSSCYYQRTSAEKLNLHFFSNALIVHLGAFFLSSSVPPPINGIV